MQTMLRYQLFCLMLFVCVQAEGFLPTVLETFCKSCVPDSDCTCALPNEKHLQISCDGHGTELKFPQVFNNSKLCFDTFGNSSLNFSLTNYRFETVQAYAINGTLSSVTLWIENNENLKSFHHDALKVNILKAKLR